MIPIDDLQRKMIAQAADDVRKRPFAAVIESAPGWRAIIVEPNPEQPGRQRLRCLPVAYWGLEGPVFNAAMRGYASPQTDAMTALAEMAAGRVPRVGPQTVLYPLDAERARIDPMQLVDVVGPDEDDETCLHRCAAFIEREARRDQAMRAQLEAATKPTPAEPSTPETP